MKSIEKALLNMKGDPIPEKNIVNKEDDCSLLHETRLP
jgi:hypothetical protein